MYDCKLETEGVQVGSIHHPKERRMKIKGYYDTIISRTIHQNTVQSGQSTFAKETFTAVTL